jgi:hypothetical protein
MFRRQRCKVYWVLICYDRTVSQKPYVFGPFGCYVDANNSILHLQDCGYTDVIVQAMNPLPSKKKS